MTHPTAPDTNAIRQRLMSLAPSLPRWKRENREGEAANTPSLLCEDDVARLAQLPADIAALLADNERLRAEVRVAHASGFREGVADKREAVSKIYLILGDGKYDRYSEQINAAKDECEKTLSPAQKEGEGDG